MKVLLHGTVTLYSRSGQYQINAENGEWSLYAVVDTEDSEVVGVKNHILIFPQIRQKDIYSIEVNGICAEVTDFTLTATSTDLSDTGSVLS